MANDQESYRDIRVLICAPLAEAVGRRQFPPLYVALVRVGVASQDLAGVLTLLADPLPLYLIACEMIGYNLVFYLVQRDVSAGQGNVDRNIF